MTFISEKLTTLEPRTDNRPLDEIIPPYLVMLHNDEIHSMDYVVDSLMQTISKLTFEKATSIMLEAHNHGIAIATKCPLEQAELYRDRLRSFGLGSTIEIA